MQRTGFHFSAVTYLCSPETQGQFSPEIELQIRPAVSSLSHGVSQVAGDAVRFVPITSFWGGRKGATPLLSIM